MSLWTAVSDLDYYAEREPRPGPRVKCARCGRLNIPVRKGESGVPIKPLCQDCWWQRVDLDSD